MASVSLHTATPEIFVTDSRGLSVRRVACLRSAAGEKAELLVCRQNHDLAERPVSGQDPRLGALGGEAVFNTVAIYSLGGLPLCVSSVDSGSHIALFNDNAERIHSWDGRATEWGIELDALGRPVVLHEQQDGGLRRAVERYEYAAMSSEAAGRNLCGRLIRHDDPAGSLKFEDYGLGGNTLRETRAFLLNMDAPDWPASAGERDAMLAPPTYTSQSLYAPTGELIEQRDAKGNRRLSCVDLVGQAADLKLQQEGGADETLVSAREYDAAGRMLKQRLGNGVVEQYQFDPCDGHLIRLLASRPAGPSLYDQHYVTDPVGNVLSITDRSQAVRHFRNQRIEPVQTRTYDSLSRLIQASGYEMQGTSLGPDLPPLTPDLADGSQWRNYTQHYQYDAADNMLMLRHEAESGNFTRRMQVMAHSNRAMPLFEDAEPPDLENGFDANGNLLFLQPVQRLVWDARNRLMEANGQRNAYGAAGVRLRKRSAWSTGTLAHHHEVLYLPGLELHDKTATGERFWVLVMEDQNLAARCLHWEEGLPGGVLNDALRYGLGDHSRSVYLEVDRDADLISEELYYPFGGTAWWAARSALEAGYKTVRYSGRERDDSGLYYYGARYYAPWLQRWISPDPAGAVDGLNLYAFARNNPTTFIDGGGLQVEWSRTRTSFGVPIQVNKNRVDLSESAQIRVRTSDLNMVYGLSSGFAAQLQSRKLNVPEVLYEQRVDSEETDYTILHTKFAIPESCIQSTEYIISYLAGDLRPFPYSPEARSTSGMELRVPNVEALGWGGPVNISDSYDVDAIFRQRNAAGLTESTLPVTLGQGLVFANSANSKHVILKNSIHFMAVTAVVLNDKKETAWAVLSDLVEPARERENEPLKQARNWAPTLVKSIAEARNNPTMGTLLKESFGVGVVQAMSVEESSPVRTARVEPGPVGNAARLAGRRGNRALFN
jgi:insecticidal toxin complex protein TccC